jgi:DNA-binding response OmpR family regulator
MRGALFDGSCESWGSKEIGPMADQPSFVLLADRSAKDYATLRATCARKGWRLRHAPDREEALGIVTSAGFGVVITEPTLLGGQSWQVLKEDLANLSCPSMIIVVSRLADEALWAEVLNLGGYDVLAMPFDDEEVERVLSSAWRHLADHAEPRR